MTHAISRSLFPVELAWLRAQTPENLSVTTVAVLCDQRLEPGCVKTRIEDNWLPERRLRERVKSSHLPLARPRWNELDRFQLSDHFFQQELAGSTHSTLEEFIGWLSSEPLDEKLPLWQIHLVDCGQASSALVFRVHAAVADSKAAAELALRLVDDHEGSPANMELGFEHQMPLKSFRDTAGSTAGATTRLCKLIASRADHASPFRGQPTLTKVTRWSAPIDLRTKSSEAPQSGRATTEALLVGVVESLRRAAHRQDIPAEDLDLRAAVSLNLRLPDEAVVGTRTALGLLRLPLRATASEHRQEAVRQSLESFVRGPEGLTLLGCDDAPSLSMTEIEERSLRLVSQKATVTLAMLDGPAQAQTLCGQAISQLLWWPALTGNTALGISVIAYAGQAQFAVSCDEALEIEAGTLVADMAAATAQP